MPNPFNNNLLNPEIIAEKGEKIYQEKLKNKRLTIKKIINYFKDNEN